MVTQEVTEGLPDDHATIWTLTLHLTVTPTWQMCCWIAHPTCFPFRTAQELASRFRSNANTAAARASAAAGACGIAAALNFVPVLRQH